MHFRRIFPLIILLMCLADIAFPQTDSLRSVLQIELNEHVGKLIKIHGEYPDNKISSITELGFFWKTQGRLNWHNHYGFPSYGCSLLHTQFGNNDILGQSIGFIPSMRFEKWKGKTRWAIRVGFGLAWFNKPYDAQSNPENLVIGSRFTNQSMLRADAGWKTSKRMLFSFGFSFTHCSNAHFAVPNIGANIVSAHAGISFISNRSATRSYTELLAPLDSLKMPKQRPRLSCYAIYGLHEAIGTIRPLDGPRYPVYGFGLFAVKWKGRGRVSVGANYHYYPYMHDYIISQELFDVSLAKRNAQTVVVFAGYEWKFGRFAFFLQGGFNAFAPFVKELNDVWDLPKQGALSLYTSNKIGYRYYAHQIWKSSMRNWLAYPKHIPYLQMAVKSNGGTADFLEFAVGLEFRKSGRPRF